MQVFGEQQRRLRGCACHADVTRGDGGRQVRRCFEAPSELDGQTGRQRRGPGRIPIDGESRAERPYRRHRAQLGLALLSTANDGDRPRVGKGEMFRGQRCDCGGPKAGQRNRVHDGQRPAVIAVEQYEHSLNGRSPMPDRIARQVHVGLDDHEDPAIVFDGRQLGVEAPAGEREAARGRPSTLPGFVST